MNEPNLLHLKYKEHVRSPKKKVVLADLFEAVGKNGEVKSIVEILLPFNLLLGNSHAIE